MSDRWSVREARARFSEMIDAAVAEGPQIVTRRGVEIGVLISIERWRWLQRMARPDLRSLLLAPEARTENLTPPRRRNRHRVPRAME